MVNIPMSGDFRNCAADLNPLVKRLLVWGTYAQRKYGLEHYAKATNVGRGVSRDYDQMLRQYDALIMPTMTTRASKMPDLEAPLSGEYRSPAKIV